MSHGFTLLELLLSFFVLALLFTAGIERIGHSSVGSETSRCANDLALLFHHTRSRAMSARETSGLTFSALSNVISKSWSQEPVTLNDFCVIQTAVFGIEGEKKEELRFSSLGNASPGHITLHSENGGPCTITVQLRGTSLISCAQ